MYASIPLIRELSSNSKAKQVWYADDAAAAGNIRELANWWSTIREHGPAFGYFVNPAKTCLVVKEEHLQLALNTFASSGIQISSEGARYLGAPLGTQSFTNQFVNEKVSEWQASLETLSSFATSQPHAAYAAMTHGLSNQWLFLQRTIPNLSPLLQPLENTIALKFIPSLTGRKDCSEIERELFALPRKAWRYWTIQPNRVSCPATHLLHLHHFSPNNCHFQPKHNLHFHHPTESKTVNPPYQPSTDQHNC